MMNKINIILMLIFTFIAALGTLAGTYYQQQQYQLELMKTVAESSTSK